MPVGDDKKRKLGDFIENPEATNPEDLLLWLREPLEEIIDTLPRQQADILRWRFGLVDGCFRTLEEIAKKLGCCRENVRQHEEKALEKLRLHPGCRKLEDFLE